MNVSNEDTIAVKEHGGPRLQTGSSEKPGIKRDV
jgi:hypothetical protein